MKTGLIIGKFMPLHSGHVALVEFAAAQCDTVIVLLCVRPGEPITGQLRLSWLWETFRFNPKVHIEYTEADLPDSIESSRSVSKAWAEYLSSRFPGVDVVFSSEHYGAYLAEYMEISYCMFDPERRNFPVSGTLVRNTPFMYWNQIPRIVQLYYTKKICIYGPESTGKSTLAVNLAQYFNTSYVAEAARAILGSRHVIYEDIRYIACTHARHILNGFEQSNKLLFCDTDLNTTRIYSQYYFRKIPEFPQWVQTVNKYDLYLFCDIDVPWIPDVQRDLGDKRQYMKELFLNQLLSSNIPFEYISGSWEERFIKALDIINAKWAIPLEEQTLIWF